MQLTGCFPETHLGKNKNWTPGRGWLVKCFAPGESTLKRDGPGLPRKSPCPMALPPALPILSHYFAVISYFPGEAGCDNLYPTVCPTTSPKQVVYKKSLGTNLCYRVTNKALYRGYTNYAPHVAPPTWLITILQGYPCKPCHMSFPS